MNALRKLLRKSEPVPERYVASHSAGRDSVPSVPQPGGFGGVTVLYPERDALPPGALDDAPPPVPVSAQPGDPTPIFDAVLTDMSWETTDESPLLHQFEVALYMDVEGADMDEAEWDEVYQEARVAVDHGWTP